MSETSQARNPQTTRSTVVAASGAVFVLAVTAVPAFSSGNVISMALWVSTIAMFSAVVIDLHLAATPERPATPSKIWRDVLTTALAGMLCGWVGGTVWSWVSTRADNCPPSAPFGGCGGEKVVIGLASLFAPAVVAVMFALLRVRRGFFIGLAATPVAALLVALYNTQRPGSPAPDVLTMALLTTAGFLLAWAGIARVVPALLRIAIATALLASLSVMHYRGLI